MPESGSLGSGRGAFSNERPYRDSRDVVRYDFSLVEREVHVWQACIPDAVPALSSLEGVLSADERARAERFYRQQDTHRFIIGRGVLRHLLGQYLALPPEQIEFDYGPHGKPDVAGAADQGVAFNLSHSRDWVVCAFTRGRAVGVDVEYMNATPEAELPSLAQTVCCPNELWTLHRLPEADRKQAFFDLWTRKEAYIKAIGTGFFLPPTEIEVRIGLDPPRLVRAAPEPNPERWSMQTLDVAEGYAAALVTEGPRPDVMTLKWSCFEHGVP